MHPLHPDPAVAVPEERRTARLPALLNLLPKVKLKQGHSVRRKDICNIFAPGAYWTRGHHYPCGVIPAIHDFGSASFVSIFQDICHTTFHRRWKIDKMEFQFPGLRG